MALLIKNIVLDKMEWASLVDKGASGDKDNRPRIVLWKRDREIVSEKQKHEVKKMDNQKALADLGLNEQQINAVLAMLEAAKGSAATPVPAEKKEPEMPAEIKKRLDDATAKQIELEKRLAEATDKARMIELEKQADQFPFVPAKKEVLIGLLKRAEDSKDTELVELLKRVNEAMKSSPVLKEHGHAGNGDEQNASAKLESIAKKFRESNPKLTQSAAFARAAKENPEIYAEARRGDR